MATSLTALADLPDALESLGQLRRALTGRHPFICLDFDGTLSEIVMHPDEAKLADGAAEALTNLARWCTVAILSGRALTDVRSRAGISGIWYAGDHGMEICGPDGRTVTPTVPPDSEAVLREAETTLEQLTDAIPGAYVERKHFSIAVHYRGVTAPRRDEVIAAAHACARRFDLQAVNGRLVIDLRPGSGWNKGTALRWIQSQAEPAGHVVPVYIGDDLTDEDAFDAIRSGGISILVRHDENPGRPTAARYTIGSPAAVCALLRRWGEERAREVTGGSSWTMGFGEYVPSDEKLREALCTVGNGYFATRGAAPESRADDIHYPGTYAAGLYNRLEDVIAGTRTQHESLVNLPNWLSLTFRIDGGDWFDLAAVSVLGYHQSVDMRTAVMTREIRFRDTAGRTTFLRQQRFASMAQPHVGALSSTLVAEDWSGVVDVRSVIDGSVHNGGVERYRDLSGAHLQMVSKRPVADGTVLLTVQTSQSRIAVAMATRTTVFQGGQAAAAHTSVIENERQIGHEMSTEIHAGESLTVEKAVTLFTGRDVAISAAAENAVRELVSLGRFAEIREAHRVRWCHLWERLDIDVTDHGEELRALRFHLMHLLQTVSPHSNELDTGVPARGLHGEAYRGHVFWDEVFIFPVLNLRFPTITRALLRYRYRRLAEARRAATRAGHAGAMFPWQSGSDGREESPRLHLNPRSGRWNPDPSHRAHHVGLAVAYNVWQYYQVSGDLAHLIDHGAELLVEIARFWVSRSRYDPDRDRYCITGVIGPDEFHTGYPDGPQCGIDNNAYTNIMAVWVVLRALDALEALPLPSRLDLRERLRLTDAELSQWNTVSRRMFVPMHDGFLSQFEKYDTLQELDWEHYRAAYGNIQRLDRILEAEGDDINRYKAGKQADVLMLLYLLSSDELREILRRLGYELAPESIPRMVDYYLARTSHGSTLSAVVNTWVLARANRDRAVDFFHQVLASDIADVQGGTTAEGIHLAAMAGSVDLVQRCFTGLETRGDRIVLSPCWPESEGPLSVSVHYRGHRLDIRVSGRGAEVSAEFRPDAAPIDIECRGRTAALVAGRSVRFEGG